MSNVATLLHPGELTLRRLSLGEAVPEDVKAHAASCAACKERLAGFADEQRRFEDEVPFDRFAAGVERAARRPAERAPLRTVTRVALALAACLVAVVAVQALRTDPAGPRGPNHLKGGGVSVKVLAPMNGIQRDGSPDPLVPEALAPGDRVMLGLRPGVWRYAVVVSVDEAGEVSTIYPEQGESLALTRTSDEEYLPDSLEFTGQGLERVIVVLSDRPVPVSEVVRETRIRFGEARGQLLHLGDLDVPGEQFHRTFLKP